MAILGRLEYWLNLDCKSFIRLASDRFERPLHRRERFRQAIHRAICHLCRLHEKRMDQLHRLVYEVARSEGGNSKPQLTPTTVERIRRAMDQAAGLDDHHL